MCKALREESITFTKIKEEISEKDKKSSPSKTNSKLQKIVPTGQGQQRARALHVGGASCVACAASCKQQHANKGCTANCAIQSRRQRGQQWPSSDSSMWPSARRKSTSTPRALLSFCLYMDSTFGTDFLISCNSLLYLFWETSYRCFFGFYTCWQSGYFPCAVRDLGVVDKLSIIYLRDFCILFQYGTLRVFLLISGLPPPWTCCPSR